MVENLPGKQSHGAHRGLVRELPGGENLGLGGKEGVVRGTAPQVRQTRLLCHLLVL